MEVLEQLRKNENVRWTLRSCGDGTVTAGLTLIDENGGAISKDKAFPNLIDAVAWLVSEARTEAAIAS